MYGVILANVSDPLNQQSAKNRAEEEETNQRAMDLGFFFFFFAFRSRCLNVWLNILNLRINFKSNVFFHCQMFGDFIFATKLDSFERPKMWKLV